MTDATTTVAGRTEEDIRSSVSAIILELAPNPEGAEGPADPRLIEDLGFHSLALLELAFTLEDEFELPPIDEASAQQIVSIEKVTQHVLGILRTRAAD